MCVVERARDERTSVLDALAAGGSVSPGAEADALLEASNAGVGPLGELLDRRLAGEPLAWIVGWVRFCDARVRVDPGVFVPRPQTEALARRAVALLPAEGIAVDLCAGSGAVSVVLGTARPRATVIATDVDPAAVACARRNGVQALLGDLDEPLPPALRGSVDVVTAVVPYVPTEKLHRSALAPAGRQRPAGTRRRTGKRALHDHGRRRAVGDPGASGRGRTRPRDRGAPARSAFGGPRLACGRFRGLESGP